MPRLWLQRLHPEAQDILQHSQEENWLLHREKGGKLESLASLAGLLDVDLDFPPRPLHPQQLMSGPPGTRQAYERQPWFQRLMRFRAGAEGRISVLKRVFGLDRSLMRGNSGTEIRIGQGIFAQNLWQVARKL